VTQRKNIGRTHHPSTVNVMSILCPSLRSEAAGTDVQPLASIAAHVHVLQVCDFGISKMKDASLAASSTRLQAGTPAYMVSTLVA
jgi:hypothetical protein